MKKLLILALLSCVSLGIYAQKSVKVQETQARLLDVMSSAYVHPLTVELHVLSTERVKDHHHLTKDFAENQLKGDMENIRSWAVFKSCDDHNCDVIVAATFNFKTSDDGNGYDIDVVGFPANFQNWKTATAADLDWIKIEKTQTTSERDKIHAIVK